MKTHSMPVLRSFSFMLTTHTSPPNDCYSCRCDRALHQTEIEVNTQRIISTIHDNDILPHEHYLHWRPSPNLSPGVSRRKSCPTPQRDCGISRGPPSLGNLSLPPSGGFRSRRSSSKSRSKLVRTLPYWYGGERCVLEAATGTAVWFRSGAPPTHKAIDTVSNVSGRVGSQADALRRPSPYHPGIRDEPRAITVFFGPRDERADDSELTAHERANRFTGWCDLLCEVA